MELCPPKMEELIGGSIVTSNRVLQFKKVVSGGHCLSKKLNYG